MIHFLECSSQTETGSEKCQVQGLGKNKKVKGQPLVLKQFGPPTCGHSLHFCIAFSHIVIQQIGIVNCFAYISYNST